MPVSVHCPRVEICFEDPTTEHISIHLYTSLHKGVKLGPVVCGVVMLAYDRAAVAALLASDSTYRADNGQSFPH